MITAVAFRLLACLLLPGSAHAAEKRIAVFVGLCDNATQGIVKVGAKIGDGNQPDDNPGAFILHDALEPWLVGKDRQALRAAAGAAYARNQKIKAGAATGVFAELAP